jgi:hypothetical protein
VPRSRFAMALHMGGARSPMPAFCAAHAGCEERRIRRPKSLGGRRLREGRSPLRPLFLRTAGTRSPRPTIVGRARSPEPSDWCTPPGRGAVLCARALSNGKAAVPSKDPFSERHSPLRPCSSRRRGRRPYRFARPRAAGRGTVPCARYSSGPRGRGPSQPTIVGGARSPVPACWCAAAGGAQSSAPVFFRTARTPSTRHRAGMGRGRVIVPSAGLIHHAGHPTGVIGRKEMDWPGCDC